MNVTPFNNNVTGCLLRKINPDKVDRVRLTPKTMSTDEVKTIMSRIK